MYKLTAQSSDRITEKANDKRPRAPSYRSIGEHGVRHLKGMQLLSHFTNSLRSEVRGRLLRPRTPALEQTPRKHRHASFKGAETEK